MTGPKKSQNENNRILKTWKRSSSLLSHFLFSFLLFCKNHSSYALLSLLSLHLMQSLEMNYDVEWIEFESSSVKCYKRWRFKRGREKRRLWDNNNSKEYNKKKMLKSKWTSLRCFRSCNNNLFSFCFVCVSSFSRFSYTWRHEIRKRGICWLASPDIPMWNEQ